ncbi:MAG: 4Fe-4S binding protein [Candidatus Cloacimonetes bacterium]|nr:4Fe-4S binding protein [Candidatus Cloacimonadota bacterium]
MKSLFYKLLLIFFVLLIFIVGCKNKINSPSDYFEIDDESCIACGKCYDVCPYNAIEFNGEKLIIIQTKCVQCGECVAVCPTDAIH